LKKSGTYNNKVMKPDIVICVRAANNQRQTVAVIEIELTHRSTPVSRRHAHNIFQGANIVFVGILRIHARRADDIFAATFAGWSKTDNGIIQCLPQCVHDFGTTPMIRAVDDLWRADMHDAADSVVPKDINSIAPANRAVGAERAAVQGPAVDILRRAFNSARLGDVDIPNTADFIIDLTEIVGTVNVLLGRQNNADVEE
jgi:hypothetical protein